MKNDLDKTIHLSKNEKLVDGLKEFIPPTATLIEPFAGDGDLVKLFDNQWELYDIREEALGTTQDTLTNPPDYKNKWVITNPPFLAKNKAKDKTLFNQYGFDDYYKIFLHTILDADGGIIIIPLNFITDENSKKIRNEFFERFDILKANLFTEPMFDSTTYSVMSFAFMKKAGNRTAIPLSATIQPQNKHITYLLEKDYGWRLAGEFFDKVNKVKPIFGRYTASSKNFITNMKLYSLDTRKEKIRIEIEEPYLGKASDRIYLTFTTDKELSIKQQKELADAFNEKINEVRDRYYNMIFTNYRDYNRKRISFTFAYKLLTMIQEEL